MGVLGKITFLGVVAIAIFIGIKLNALFEVPPMPKLEDTWWGPGQPSKVDTSIKPFKINVPEKVLLDLKDRLKNARPFTPPLEGVQHQYGMNTNLLTKIVEFWRTSYDWRARERWMNRYPQFTTNVQGLDIHYIHVKPTITDGLKVIPLLLLHGWPGSVREFYGIIPLLTTPRKGEKFVFEVIIPSLPGYGFSQGAAKPGLGAAQVAVVFKNLMTRLGFDKYYIQGGDWGGIIVTHMATLFPDKILGMHANMCFVDSPLSLLKRVLGSFYPPLVVDKEFEHKLYPLSSFFEFVLLEFGYLHLQATKPDTVGVTLNDSPVGLVAYILEKFITWTNVDWNNRADGGLQQKFRYDDLLDNVMIYWVTNSATTSARLYSESFNKAQTDLKLSSIPITVPSACARFPNEIGYTPDSLLTLKYANLIHTSDLEDGGHFAAFEVPELLSNDIWTALSKMEHYHASQRKTK